MSLYQHALAQIRRDVALALVVGALHTPICAGTPARNLRVDSDTAGMHEPRPKSG